MNEALLLLIVFVLSALPTLVVGLKFRSGAMLTLMPNAERITDRAALGRFMGNRMLAISVILIAMGAVPLLTPPAWIVYPIIAGVALLQWPILSMLIGLPRYFRPLPR